MVYKKDLMFVRETTWMFVAAFFLPWLLHREFGRSTAGQGLWELLMWLSRILGLSWSCPFPYAHGISRA